MFFARPPPWCSVGGIPRCSELGEGSAHPLAHPLPASFLLMYFRPPPYSAPTLPNPRQVSHWCSHPDRRWDLDRKMIHVFDASQGRPT